MQCRKCGITNPDSARFCFECGTALPELVQTDFTDVETSKYCPKCNASNPKDGRFCFECGNPLEDVSRPQSRQCPTCGISIDTLRLFCPNCGQSLVEKPLEVKKEQFSTPSKEIHVECPACGQLTIGDYCRSCGYNLTTRQRKRLIDWWYCDRDSAIMTEIDPNSQILVSRSSLDESLAQAIDSNLLQQQDRENARLLAFQLFEDNTKTKFEVISQVRCPVCSHQSLAPTTKRPHQVGTPYIQEISLNVGSMLQNGIFYLRNYPQLLLITICAIMIDGGLFLLGFSSFSTSSLFSFLGLPLMGTTSTIPVESFLDPITSLIITLIISFVFNIFIQCWYYTSLKEIITNESPLNAGISFKKSFRYFPRTLAAQFLIFVGSIGIIIVVILVFIIFVYFFRFNTGYQILLLLVLLLIGIIGFGALTMILNILFSYVNMSIVFDEESGIILSLKRSWRFARKYFWTTLGIIIIFSVGSSILIYIQTFSYMFFYIAVIPGVIFLLIYTILNRLIEAYKAISMGWGYQTFHYMID